MTAMREETKTINDVKEYWSNNPVHSVEFKEDHDKRYFEDIDKLRWSDNERWAKDRFYEFGDGRGKRLLDAGCGIGVFSRFYARRNFDICAIDISDSAVELTRKSLDLFGLKGDVRSGSVEAMPYPDNHFDYIVSNGVIHHTPDTEKAADEFFRVLKPGGIASVCVYYKNIFLRQPLFSIARLMLKIVLKKKDGREKFLTAETPEEFVRTYDGNDTPIAKLYTRKQTDKLFSRFEVERVELHYFPIRFLKGFKTGGLVHKIMDRSCGVLIYYLLRKPA